MWDALTAIAWRAAAATFGAVLALLLVVGALKGAVDLIAQLASALT